MLGDFQIIVHTKCNSQLENISILPISIYLLKVKDKIIKIHCQFILCEFSFCIMYVEYERESLSTGAIDYRS